MNKISLRFPRQEFLDSWSKPREEIFHILVLIVQLTLIATNHVDTVFTKWISYDVFCLNLINN